MKPTALKGDPAWAMPYKWFYREEDFARKTQWFILWRLVFVSFFLFLTVIQQEIRGILLIPSSFFGVYFWIALQYGFSVFYILWLITGRAVQWAAVTQLLVDGLVVSALVVVTGGIESFFPYLYFLVIVAGGVLFHRPGGLLTALYVSLLYGSLLLIQAWGATPFFLRAVILKTPHSGDYYIYQIIMHGVGFLLVGYLGSSFAEQTVQQRGQLEIQKRNIDQLEGLNRIIIENLDFGLITLDNENTIQTLNPAGEKILGLDLDQLKHKPLDLIFPDIKPHPGALDNAGPNRLEFIYQTPLGVKVPIGCSFNTIRADSTLGLGKILSFKDISKIKAMEDHLRQIDRLALMGKMAAGMAHEIKNPLASISGSIQVLQEDFKGEQTSEQLLKIMTREVTRLNTLVNSFLSFSKPVQEVKAFTDISELIQGTVELIRKNREVSAVILWDLEIEPRLIVNISSGEMSQVAWNILTNAVQVLKTGGKISIKGHSLQNGPSGNWAELVFRDNGSGISEKDLTKIFDPFYTTKEQGIGLGLNIVQKIIADRGGRIDVKSSPGQGTEFTIIFPLAGIGR
jgi:two-component system sensor histidine kinase PilS (NtrC family)